MIARLTLVTLTALALAAQAAAQTYDGLAIVVEARTVDLDGGERPNTASSTAALTVGKTHNAAFAQRADMCGFGVAQRLASEAMGGWTVSVTPTAVEDDAVTFEVQWARVPGPSAGAADGRRTVTLRPGESMPLDLVPTSPALTYPYERCGVRATSLHVAVSHWPLPHRETRVLATELWLIERLADGSERTQALSLRGRPHEKVPFYFDALNDAGVDFELYGDAAVGLDTAHPGEVVVSLTARGRLTENGRASTVVPMANPPAISDLPGPLMQPRSVESTIRFAAGEVVDVQLPRLTENASGAFAGRTFWLRLRVRQIR